MNDTMKKEIVGRGTREGAALFRDWFQDLTQKAENGETAAYVFVMGSLAEILRVFDLPMVRSSWKPRKPVRIISVEKTYPRRFRKVGWILNGSWQRLI